MSRQERPSFLRLPTMRRAQHHGRHRATRRAAVSGFTAISLVMGTLVMFGVTSTPQSAQAAAGDPFDATRAQVFVAQDNPTRLYRAVTDASGTVSFTPEGPVRAITYNAIAYRTADNYLYGTVLNSNGYDGSFPNGALIRIGQDGVLTRVGNQTYGTSLVGTFGSDGYYYKTTDAASTLQVINVANGNVVRTVELSGSVGSDFTFKDGFLWTLGGSEILRTNPTTGVVTSFPFTNPSSTAAGAAGAAWTFGNGNLGFSSNVSGTVTQIAVDNPASANPTFRVISQTEGPASSNNDGAASPGLPTDLEIEKSAPATFVPGEEITYTLTVTNNGDGVSSGYTVTDTLPDGLTDIDTESPGCTISGRTVTCAGGELEVDDSVSIEITAKTPLNADGCFTNTASVLANEADPVAANNSDSAQSCTGRLVVTKTSDATADTRVGDTVTYTVTATNAGEADYTDSNPAVVLDDLTGVLDDATFNDDAQAEVDGSAAADPSFESPLLAWSGPLAVDESVTMTYSVTLKAGGDGRVRNLAFASPCDPSDEDCEAPTTPTCASGEVPETTLSCASSQFDLPKLQIDKSADRTTVPAEGTRVTYTVTATNVGPGDYTTSAPAIVVDDLTKVIDDATLDLSSLEVTSGAAPTYVEPRITWSGALASGDSVTLTYEVVYTGDGDNKLGNVAFAPSNPTDPTPVCQVTGSDGTDSTTGIPCDAVQIPGAGLSVRKSVNPSDGTSVKAGDVVTYTLTFDNDGSADATVDHTDYLGDVVDDAELLNVDAGTGLVVDDADPELLVITGSVAAGTQSSVTYTVRVLAADERGNNRLGNVVAPSSQEPPGPDWVCAGDDITCTVNPVRELEITKSVSPTSGTGVKAGDELTYTLTFRNRGSGPEDVEKVDDLRHVLDDATITEAAETSDADALTVWPVTGQRLPITGTIAGGQTVTVTYTVTVKDDGDRGDNLIANFLLDPTDVVPSTPECAATSKECTLNPVSEITASKTVDPASGTAVAAGDELTYTLTFENIGKAAGSFTKLDDLTHVLDDAEVTDGPEVSDEDLAEVSPLTDDQFEITGELAAGESVTMTYKVTVKDDGDRGDNLIGNFLLNPGQSVPSTPACDDEALDCTLNPVSQITASKTVDPASGTAVAAGDELTYTLTFENEGKGAGSFTKLDDLTHVLDDAEVTSDPVALDDAAVVISELENNRYSFSGEIPAGATFSVRYTVTVKDDGDRGDNLLGNFLLNPGQTVPSTPSCGEDATNCTLNPVSEITASKTVDPASGTAVQAGDELTYTLIFENEGKGAGSFTNLDDLTHVVDDAEVTDGPYVSDPDLAEISPLTDDQFEITGELAAGESVTVTYTVTVKADGDRGDNLIGNFLLNPGQSVPSTPVCDDESLDCTLNPVSQITSSKSVNPGSGTSVQAGDELTYTLTFTNDGQATASFTKHDDLTHLLDDAEVTDGPEVSDEDLAEVSALTGNQFTITGELAVDETVTVTYKVTVKDDGDRGDNLIGNFLLNPGQTVPLIPTCTSVETNCTLNPVSQIVSSKTVDPTSGTGVKAGDELTYTLEFENIGEGAGSFTKLDDLTHVVDDAEVTDGPEVSDEDLAEVSPLTDDQFEITGELAADETVTITYTVRVKDDGDRGDNLIGNFLLNPGQSVPSTPACDDEALDCTLNPVSEITASKTVDPVSGTAVAAGDELTYTLTFENVGETAGTFTKVDDLTHVLDDAEVTSDPVALDDAAVVISELENNRYSFSGEIPAGATFSVRYTVTVKDDGDRGDNLLGNYLLNPGQTVPSTPSCGEDATNCTLNPVSEIVSSKTVDPASGTGVEAGDELTYTLTFHNRGEGRGSFTKVDDLTHVLDDAEVTATPEASDADLAEVSALTGNQFTITGDLGADETVTISYTVTVKDDGDRGDNLIGNFLLNPGQTVPSTPVCDDDAVDCTLNPVSEITASKTVNPASGEAVKAGDELTYTLEFENVGKAAAAFTKVDDLTHVLDDAEVTDGPEVSDEGLAEVSPLTGNQFTITGELAAGESVTVTYTVTVKDDGDRGDNLMGNFLLNPGQSVPSTPVCDDEALDCTLNPIAEIISSKTADPASGTSVKAGDELTYTLEFENIGEGAGSFTKIDDLTHVLDDADVTDQPEALDGADVTISELTGNQYTLTGEIPAGTTVQVRYTVTVKDDGDRGDNLIGNFLLNPGQTVPSTPACDDEALDCTLNPIAEIVSSKTVDPASGTGVKAGDELTYTLTFENIGEGRGSFTKLDDLTHVVDDAEVTDGPYVSDPDLAEVSPLTDDQFTITGDLAADETVTISYTVTVKDDGDRGDNLIGNFLLNPGQTVPSTPACDDEALDCTLNGVSEIISSKTVDPVSGTGVKAGDELTYTLTFENIGKAAGPFTKIDDLTHVLDDADVTDGPDVSDADAVAVSELDDDQFTIDGNVAAGESVTVTYTVTVKDDGDRGDNLIGNFLLNPGQTVPSTPACDEDAVDCTLNGVSEIISSKTVDPASGTGVKAGDELTYTLTFENVGKAAGPFTKLDDLTHVLDDADLTDGPEVSDEDLAEVSPLTDDQFTITGDLAADETVTVTYTVTVKDDGDRGDNLIGNFLLNPGQSVPSTPACDEDAVDCTLNGVSEIISSKTVDPASGTGLKAGDEVTYTLEFENIGKAAGPFTKIDDLTHVLDDAEVTVDPEASDPDNVEISDLVANQYTISGDIAAGQTVTVTYTVTVMPDGDRGDNLMGNFLLNPDQTVPSTPVCAQDAVDCTLNPIAEIVSSKTVDPASGTEVKSGSHLTYTLEFENIGKATGDVAKVDDLRHVLDDADITTAPVASDPALTVSELDNNQFTITGEVEPDQTITVTYTVTVRSYDERGDSILGNFLVNEGQDVPTLPGCDEEAINCTVNYVSEYIDSKTVDPASGGVVQAGDELNYTLEFTNVGSVPVAVERVDDLRHLLDDATITQDPTASDAALTVSAIDEGRFTVAGELGVDQTVTVTYTAEVNPDGERGDHIMANFLLDPDQEAPEDPNTCEGQDCTVNRAPELGATKTVTPQTGTPVVAGQELTYTLTFTNTGAAAGQVAKFDDLTHVIDDATVTAKPVVSDEALSVETIKGRGYLITGELTPEQTVTVTYTVTVKPAKKQGDKQIANFLMGPDDPTPSEPVCAIGLDCTFNPVGDIMASKTSNPASGEAVKDGQTVTYTLEFENVGKGSAWVNFTDDMSDVLDDAQLIGKPKVSSTALEVGEVTRGSMAITGELEAGAKATVTYQVKIDAKAGGNGEVANYLLGADALPVGGCDDDGRMCTTHPIEVALPDAGAPVSPWVLLGALLLLVGGGGMLVGARRRRVN